MTREHYILNLVSPTKDHRVLTIGLSNIPTLEQELENKVGECWAVDIDKEKLYNARALLADTHIIYQNIEEPLPLYFPSFDTIIMLEVLEHLDQDENVLRTLHSLLKPNGSLIISVPNTSNWHLLNPLKYTQHKRHYSKTQIVSLLEKTGFKVVHFNVVESWTLLANLYVHLFFKYILRKQKPFVTFKKKAERTYDQINTRGLDIVVKAVKK